MPMILHEAGVVSATQVTQATLIFLIQVILTTETVSVVTADLMPMVAVPLVLLHLSASTAPVALPTDVPMMPTNGIMVDTVSVA